MSMWINDWHLTDFETENLTDLYGLVGQHLNPNHQKCCQPKRGNELFDR